MHRQRTLHQYYKYIGGLKLASNNTAKIEATGDVRITASISKNEKQIRFTDTLYVPDLRTNLMSVAKIVDAHNQVLFTKDRAIVRDPQGKTVMIANRINNLFYLQDNSQKVYIANDDRKSLTRTWHERLGHSHLNAVRSMWKGETVIGMKLEGEVTPIDCRVCAIGKLTSASFPTRGPRSSGRTRHRTHGRMRTDADKIKRRGTILRHLYRRSHSMVRSIFYAK